ncbi:MAG: peptidoglycan-binding protein [Archangium sp.]|nr:peptidoglycan-binding protein [Archangium sp.]
MSVRIGARGTPVTQIQESLNAHGASGLGVDGRFGRDTRAAVIAFQRSHGLTPDGVVGPRTAAALGLSGDAFEPARPSAPGGRTAPSGGTTPTPGGPSSADAPPAYRPPPADAHPYDRMSSMNEQMADRLAWYREHGRAVPPAELAAARRLDEMNGGMVLPLATGDLGLSVNRLAVSSGRLHDEVARAH